MFQYFSAILYVHFRNSREGKSTSWVENHCAPHPLNKSLPYSVTGLNGVTRASIELAATTSPSKNLN